MKKIVFLFLTFIFIVSVTSCSAKVPKNSVFTPADIPGKSIGVMNGSAAETYTEGYDIVHLYSERDTMLADLKNGVLDCIIMDRSTAEILTEKEPRVKILSDVFAEEAFSFVIAKENADLTSAINTALSDLKDNGILQNIIDGYLLDSGYTYVSPENIDYTAGTLTLVVDADFSPYESIDENGEITGLDIDLCRAVCDILGVDLVVTTDQSNKLVTTVRFGKADFAMGRMTANEADSEMVDFSEPYVTSTQVVIVRKK